MIPLYKPYIPSNLPHLNNILQSGEISYGKWGQNFEKVMQNYIGSTERPVSTGSYTTTLFVMLQAAGIKPGDEIIASPLSCLGSTMPLKAYGADVVWADIDPASGTLSPDSVREKITSKTRMIFHNHGCGYPGHIDEINALGREYGILTVDDCIEAFGAEYKGRKMGNTGSDITTFSFQTVRLPNTLDGGAVVFNKPELTQRALIARDYGVDRTCYRLENGEINPQADVTEKGYGAMPKEPGSYIGYETMQQLPNLIQRQRENAAVWRDMIATDFNHCQLLSAGNSYAEPNYWVFGLLSDHKLDDIQRFNKLGFEASGVHLPNTHYSIFGNQGRFPGVEDFYRRFFAIPSGWWLTL